MDPLVGAGLVGRVSVLEAQQESERIDSEANARINNLNFAGALIGGAIAGGLAMAAGGMQLADARSAVNVVNALSSVAWGIGGGLNSWGAVTQRNLAAQAGGAASAGLPVAPDGGSASADPESAVPNPLAAPPAGSPTTASANPAGGNQPQYVQLPGGSPPRAPLEEKINVRSHCVLSYNRYNCKLPLSNPLFSTSQSPEHSPQLS